MGSRESEWLEKMIGTRRGGPDMRIGVQALKHGDFGMLI